MGHPGQDCSNPMEKYLYYCNSAIREDLGFVDSFSNDQPQNIADLYPSNPPCSKVAEFELEKTNPGVTLAWQNLSVYVPDQKHQASVFKNSKGNKQRSLKQVLHNVTGVVSPGSLVAILGASGAGKTTLMNVLAYRARGDVVTTGQMLANGIPTGKFMNLVSGYVHQNDIFCGSLTVAEHLHFMARMKMDRTLRTYEREHRVEELLVELGLKRCQNTLIGIPGEITGISGGERKRLAFASEILTDPPLLFCDEPTTNLDSFSALKLVRMMRKMTSTGKTILCTIHQPSSEVFDLFDRLCLLAEGRTAYMGTPTGALRFLHQLNYRCPNQFNPADFFIRTLAVQPGKEAESQRRIKAICDAFAISEKAKALEEKVEAESKISECLELSVSSTDSSRDKYILAGGHLRRPFWLTKTFWLTHRAFIDSYRNPRVHVLRSIQKFILGIIVGLCFYGVRISSQTGIQDVQGALFVFINENSFPALYGVMAVFPLEFPLFLREHKAGLYDVNSYYISKMVALLPGFIIEPLIFTALAYTIIGLRSSLPVFFFTCLVCIFTANTAAACGCFFSAYFDDITTANSVSPIISMFMILSGLFINIQSTPGYLTWTQYFSWFLYSNEALSIGQWQGVTNITCEDLSEPCVTTGNEVLESRGFDPTRAFQDLFGMGFIYVFFHIAAYLSLLSKSRKN